MLPLAARRVTVAMIVITVVGTPLLAGSTCCRGAMLSVRAGAQERSQCCCRARASEASEEPACCAPAGETSCCAAEPTSEPAAEPNISPLTPCRCKAAQTLPAVSDQRGRLPIRLAHESAAVQVVLPVQAIAPALGHSQFLSLGEAAGSVATQKLLCRWIV